MTQSGRVNGESGWIPSSASRESPIMTMSFPLWLRVSSEYPSSNLFALIEEAGRKGCMYGGPENWAGGLPSGPAMLGCSGVDVVRKKQAWGKNYMGVVMDSRVFALLPAGREFRSCG